MPAARVAWTGNMVLGEGLVPWAIEGGAPVYLRTLAAFASGLDVETIVSGHGLMTSGAGLTLSLSYLREHIGQVQDAIDAGHSLDETLAQLPLSEGYQPPADSPLAAVPPVMQGFHRWNVKKTYEELSAE